MFPVGTFAPRSENTGERKVPVKQWRCGVKFYMPWKTGSTDHYDLRKYSFTVRATKCMEQFTWIRVFGWHCRYI